MVYRLTSLDKKLEHFDETVDPAILAQLPTIRRMFIMVLGASPSSSAEESLMMYATSMKIKNAEDTILLSENELSVLRAKCFSNALNWAAHYHAQILLKIREIENDKQEDKR